MSELIEIKDKVVDTVMNTREEINVNGVKLMVEVSEVFNNKNLHTMIALILDDPLFIDKVGQSIKNILNDGRVDESDIPEFIFLIMEAYNSLPEARLSKEEMPVFISCIFNYLVEKYNLIPLEQRDKYEKMVVSSIKLVLMMPQFKTITRWVCPCW